MEPAETSFISTSYHTERLGPAAAVATIKKMQAVDAIQHNCAMGRQIKHGWKQAAAAAKIHIEVSGIDPWPSFSFGAASAYSAAPAAVNSSPLKTLFTQEMLQRGFLATTVALPSFA